MRMTLTDVQGLMQDFYFRNNKSIPNAILMPSENMAWMDRAKFEEIFKMKIVFAAITHPRVCIL